MTDKKILNDKNLDNDLKIEHFQAMMEENYFLGDSYCQGDLDETLEQVKETLKEWPETTLQNLLTFHRIPNKVNLCLDSNRGQYIPKNFFECYQKHIQKFYNSDKKSKGMYKTLKKELLNPECEEYYEAWDYVLSTFQPVYKGIKYTFTQDGDVWELEFWSAK